MPGIPVGPGTVFYLLAALCMPVVGIGRRIAGGRSAIPMRGTGRQAAVALGMVFTGALSFWLFDAVGRRINGHHTGTGILVLSSPLLLALTVLAAMVAVSRVARRIGR
jgi:apolipoprotein N-acyltransferase